MTHQSILVVTRNYPPLTGGMERLMQHTLETLASRFEVTLIGPSGCSKFVPDNVTVIESPPAPFSFLALTLFKGWQASRKSSFDFVLGGSGLVAPITLFLSTIAKARSVIFVHGLDLVVENAVYQWLFVPFLHRHDLVIANSRNTRKIAVDKGCQPNKVRVLNPGTTIPAASVLDSRATIRKTLDLNNNKLILFVGRIVRRKGLTEFLEKTWPQIMDAQEDAILLVVGDSPDNALLGDPKEAQRLTKAIQRCRNNTIRFLGAVADDELWACYAAADALIFPLIRVTGDVEGFGMVAIEAAACGTPTIAFPVGGVIDAVADGINGLLVPEGDYAAFADAVLSVCEGGPPSRSDCRGHAEKFSWDEHSEKLLSILQTSVST